MGWKCERWPVRAALAGLMWLAGCAAPPAVAPSTPPATPAPPASEAELFRPPALAAPPSPVVAAASQSPAIGPIATRVSVIVSGTSSPGASLSSASSSPDATGRPSPSPNGGPSTAPIRSPSPGASPSPGPLAGTLAYARGGSIVVQGAAGGEPRTLVAGADLSEPRWSPDGRSILFTGGVGQAAELFLVPASGGPPRRLTTNARPELAAAMSPRGDRVAYALARRVGPDGRALPDEPEEVWVLDLATGVERKVADGSDPAWSPDGARLAYASNGRRTDLGATENAIHVVRADGQGDRAMLAVSAIPQDLQPTYPYPFRPATFRLRAPAWAPDGRRLAASADGHTALVATFDEAGQDLRVWALAYEGGVGRARWSGRGDRLAVESEPATDVPVVLVIDVSTGREARIGGIREGFSARAPAWSPDGVRLAVVTGLPTERPSAAPAASELRIYTADGGAVRTVSAGRIEAPTWVGTGP